MKKENIRKYPKSINNKQCVSQCYKAHTSVFHPTRFIYIREDYPFCATAVYEEKNPITGKIIERNTDRCLNPTVDADVLSEQMLLVPESEFTRESFLAMYYNIRTFDDIEKWLSENPNVPLGTKIRNVNCAFVSYGKDIDIFDNGLLLFLIEYIKKRWMAIYYSKLGKYIGMNENENKDKDDRELHLVNPEKNALKDDELIVERTNYICVKFITLDNIRNFMVKFIKARQSEWDDIYDFLEYIARDLSVNIENKILTAIAN